MTDIKFDGTDIDLGAFRYAAAKYVKFLIRARSKIKPGFLSDEELKRWQLTNIREDLIPETQLLLMAGAQLAFLNTNFINRCGSGGVAEYDQATAEGRLMTNIAFFVTCSGGGPYHNDTLILAALGRHEGQSSAWDSLVDWSKLSEIRNDLDKLPHPSSTPTAHQGDAVAENVFRREGKSWNIRFQGGKLFAVDDGPGPTYLYYLMNHPDEKIDVHELSREWDRVRAGNRLQSNEEEGLSVDNSMNEPIVDTQSIAEAKKAYASIQAEIAVAQKNNDLSRIERLTEQRRSLSIQMSELFTPSGRLKRLDPNAKKVRNRVYSAIKRVIDNLRENDPSLGRHLEQHVNTGWKCEYSSDKTIVWSL